MLFWKKCWEKLEIEKILFCYRIRMLVVVLFILAFQFKFLQGENFFSQVTKRRNKKAFFPEENNSFSFSPSFHIKIRKKEERNKYLVEDIFLQNFYSRSKLWKGFVFDEKNPFELLYINYLWQGVIHKWRHAL